MFKFLFKKKDHYVLFALEPVVPADERSREVSPPKVSVQDAAEQGAVDAGIAYRPGLIGEFCGEHDALRKQLDSVRQHAARSRFVAAQKALRSFQVALRAHFLDEHTRLYAHLSARLVEDYASPGSMSRDRQRFLVELDAVSGFLLGHLEREEACLYALYTPVDDASSA